TSSGPPLSRVIRPKGARLLKCCAHGERFLIHSAGPTPSTALTAPTIALGASPLPPSRGEALRPRGFSHRRGDAKSLVYFLQNMLRCWIWRNSFVIMLLR